jgi:homogentisate 1,2-dioxygenase
MTHAYMTGFGNEFSSEAVPGALPIGQNSPQQVPLGLYAEQISGTAFTAPRADNRRSWLYRMRPAAVHGDFVPYSGPSGWQEDEHQAPTPPSQLRWSPLPMPSARTDFVDGIRAFAGNGGPAEQQGAGICLFACNASMERRYCYSADGELLIIVQQGRLQIATELGVLEIEPQEIAVIPRGIRFRVSLPDGQASGYLCENYGSAFRLPDLGVIGSNGLANPRDFQVPVAAFENDDSPCELIAKFMGKLWLASMQHSPLDVVAWHGNHVPYKYDLRRFNTIGSISYDHPDPSIFLVLQSVSETPGVDNIDFVIFPPRILAMEHTFRPPWFHRNIASEFMGLIHGAYDAKAEGFSPGGCSLHNCMSGHGPDATSWAQGVAADTSKAHYIRDTMAFMIETRKVIRPTHAALNSPQLQKNYAHCWHGFQKNFR